MRKFILIQILLFSLITIHSEELVRTINVIGKGSIVIKPDTVVISTGVDSGHTIIGEALAENNEIMSKIFQGLADLGIAEENIQTSNYNVYFHKPYHEDKNDKAEYRVSNSIKISIKNLDLVDSVIDTLITLGANKINGIYFTFEDENRYKKDLRALAMKDAREKAEFLASTEGMKLAGVISISELGTPQNQPVNYEYALSDSRSGGAIAVGNETISIKYNVKYEMKAK